MLGGLVSAAALTTVGASRPAAALEEGVSRVVVGTRTFEYTGAGASAALERAVDDERAVYRAVQPQKAAISNKSFVETGPLGQPRLSFTARGPLRITVDITTDFSSRPIGCEGGVTGRRFVFDLRDSEAKLVEFLSEFALDLCVYELADESLVVRARTSLRPGPRWRRGFVSMILHPIVRAQTAEFVRVLIARADGYRGVTAAR